MPIDFENLKSLNKQKKVVFAYLASLRVYSNALLLVKNYNHGSEEVFKKSVTMLKDAIFQSKNYSDILYQLDLLDKNIPGTNVYPNYDGAIAMNCGGVIYSGIEILTDDDPNQSIEDLSTMLTDAIDLYIQEKNDMDYNETDFEEKILNDPIMVKEINIQNSICGYLTNISDVGVNDLDYLINLQQDCILNLSFEQ